MDDFVVRALIAGVGLAVIAGPLGCFVVWRRMAYFGDTLAHSSFLGVTLGWLLGVDPMLGVAATASLIAVLLTAPRFRRELADDTLLGILAHGSLAFGMLALTFADTLRVDLMGLLFGDILSVTRLDIAWIAGGGIVALAVLARLWRPLLAVAVDEELARVAGYRVGVTRTAFALITALTVAAGMRIVGALLVTALLVIPAAAARRLARTPEEMALFAAIIGALSVCGGIAASLWRDLPAGPAITATAALIFVALSAAPLRR